MGRRASTCDSGGHTRSGHDRPRTPCCLPMGARSTQQRQVRASLQKIPLQRRQGGASPRPQPRAADPTPESPARPQGLSFTAHRPLSSSLPEALLPSSFLNSGRGPEGIPDGKRNHPLGRDVRWAEELSGADRPARCELTPTHACAHAPRSGPRSDPRLPPLIPTPPPEEEHKPRLCNAQPKSGRVSLKRMRDVRPASTHDDRPLPEDSS